MYQYNYNFIYLCSRQKYSVISTRGSFIENVPDPGHPAQPM